MHVRDFKNKYKNKLAFILGAGPSLYNIDNSIFQNHITFAVNSAILKYPCNYFVSDDNGVTNWDYFNKIEAIKFLYEKEFLTHKLLDKTIYYNHKLWYDVKSNKKYLDGVRLTKGEPIIGAATSAGSALHLAYIMGCNPVILLGFDCCYYDGKKYFWQFWNKKRHPCKIKNRYEPPIFDLKALKNEETVDKHYITFEQYWQDFVNVNKDIIEKEFNIINCSGGILNVFKRKPIEEVVSGI